MNFYNEDVKNLGDFWQKLRGSTSILWLLGFVRLVLPIDRDWFVYPYPFIVAFPLLAIIEALFTHGQISTAITNNVGIAFLVSVTSLLVSAVLIIAGVKWKWKKITANLQGRSSDEIRGLVYSYVLLEVYAVMFALIFGTVGLFSSRDDVVGLPEDFWIIQTIAFIFPIAVSLIANVFIREGLIAAKIHDLIRSGVAKIVKRIRG